MHIPRPHELLQRVIAWQGAHWKVVGKFSCPCGFRGGPRNIREHRHNCPDWQGYSRVSWRNFAVNLAYHPKPMWHPQYPELCRLADTVGIHHPDFVDLQEKVIWPWCQAEVWRFVRYDHARNGLILNDGAGDPDCNFFTRLHMVEPIP